MRYKSLFRMYQKLIGLGLIVFALPALGTIAIQLTVYFFFNGSSNDVAGTYFNRDLWWVYIVNFVLSPVIQLLIGLYLFFDATWIANLAIPSNRRYCVECGYEMRDPVGAACPECGTLVHDKATT